jgi:hypothetical protein
MELKLANFAGGWAFNSETKPNGMPVLPSAGSRIRCPAPPARFRTNSFPFAADFF